MTITAENIQDACEMNHTGSYYDVLADLLASMFNGTVHRAETTHSKYVSIPGAKTVIRISNHSKYGMRHPSHVLTTGSKSRTAARLNRAIKYVGL